MTELLPCPFCGGKPMLRGPHNPGPEYWVACQSCHASSLIRSNGDATRAAWNARVVAQQPPESELRKALQTIANMRWREDADLDDICTIADRALNTTQRTHEKPVPISIARGKPIPSYPAPPGYVWKATDDTPTGSK